MKILILGGTGAIGSHLINFLAQNSENNIYITSRQKRENYNNIHYIRGNAQEIAFLKKLLQEMWDIIIDFMLYDTVMFKDRVNLLLESTKHYIFLSSARVYADSEFEITEESPRLLDVITDERYLSTDEYALTKARQENTLFESNYRNWTIIRPYITYSEERLQFGGLEKENWLYRGIHGRSILFSENIFNKKTTLTYGRDVAFGIFKIIESAKNAYGEIFNIVNNEVFSWEEIFNIYNDTFFNILGKRLNIKLISNEQFINCSPSAFQIIYDRMYNRKFNTSKIGKIVDVLRFTSVKNGLENCLSNFLCNQKFQPIDWRIHAKMDKLVNEKTPECELKTEKNKYIYINGGKRMKEHGYNEEQNVQVLIALLKAHGIKKVIASPGTTNIAFIGSIQYDPDFELYSCVDERSAAYMACGMAEESGEPVCLSCTGATASRNYLPGLTEAFYRKLPILAITSTQYISRIGHNIPQVIDRSNPPKDTVKYNVTLPVVKDRTDFWDCVDKVNIALLELNRNGGGPVQINLQTGYSKNFNVYELPYVRVIKRITHLDIFPKLPNGKIGIFVGSHKRMSSSLVNAIDKFCEVNDAVVFCDHTSSYYGKYKVLPALITCQKENIMEKPDTLIYIGEMTGDYCSFYVGANEEVWRVSNDGEVRDPVGRLTYVFDMEEEAFFKYYSSENSKKICKNEYISYFKNQLNTLKNKITEIPFSNIWMASILHNSLPKDSVIHFGILNSLKAWNFFDLPKGVEALSNVGGFGIDGCVSSLVGASIINPNKLYFLIVGDLAFFYDMNVLGNKHIGNNVRILLVNNGKGTEFRNPGHYAQIFGEDADKYISGSGHFGNKSKTLIKHYAEDLGFLYLTASTKEEFLKLCDNFTNSEIGDKPILFEVFTTHEDEGIALESMMNLT